MKQKNRRTPWALALALALLLALSAPLLALAADWFVDTYAKFITAASTCTAGDVIILTKDIARTNETAKITVDNVTVKSEGNNTFEIKNGGGATGRLLEVTGDAFTMDHIAMSGGSTTATGESGGALYAAHDATLSHCEFTGNHTEGIIASGGAVYIAGHATVENSTFTDNYTMGIDAQGGALYAGDGADISGSTFSGNHNEGDIGAGGGAYIVGDTTITDSTFSENYTEGNHSFGGGAVIWGEATITNSTFSENHADGFSSCGGGVHITGDTTITDSTFVNNYTEGETAFGGGGAAIFGDAIITDSTFEGNESHQGVGGGLYQDTISGGSTLTLTETDFYNNTSATGGGAITAPTTDITVHGTNYFEGNAPEGSQHGIQARSINFAPGAQIVEGRRANESEPAGGNVASIYLVTKNTTLYADAEKTTPLRNLSAGTKVSVRHITSGMAYTPDGFIPFDALRHAP